MPGSRHNPRPPVPHLPNSPVPTIRPEWTPDSHHCGGPSCKTILTSDAARTRCYGKHVLACSGYHTRLHMITAHIQTSRDVSNESCNTCKNGWINKEVREKEVYDATRAAQVLRKIELYKEADKQDTYADALKKWSDNVTARAQAETDLRRIGFTGWLSGTSKTPLSEHETKEFESAMATLNSPQIQKPAASLGISATELERVIREYEAYNPVSAIKGKKGAAEYAASGARRENAHKRGISALPSAIDRILALDNKTLRRTGSITRRR